MTPDALAALHAAAFPHDPWSAQDFAAFLQDPTTLLVTCAQGFAVLRVVLDEAEVLTLAVAPAARGKGHGTALLSAAQAQAAERGATRIFLEVATDNVAARALYARAGFVQTGQRRGYYTRTGTLPADALLLERGLA
ncbi:Ribosomal-protein-alanine acetyltransferase [Roseibaca ekhonensis]|uniref:[Ribosomal protein bS18]-alanine N-acetyltransferase n=1 Tax=Roseinatronobacter ekhonensis TaxID=254356 RepID=A0A3B0MQQ0_9RHOB|nr:ribosomal protein S18-alanine N-acetyltransferase [Roseibaca ekhonensis]SUZ31949.1 Ribosomal-protein-alanine acetyltransferase [Roseibaca ekhonensis]